jgi:hypothetical protein
MSGPTALSCSDTSTVAINAGDRVGVRITVAASANSVAWTWAFTLE